MKATFPSLPSVLALGLACAATLPAQSYKPFNGKPTCKIEPAAQSQYCGAESQTFTVTLTGFMGDDAMGPYTIRAGMLPDADSYDWRASNPGFPAKGKALTLRIKFKLRCAVKSEGKCFVESDSSLLESFEYDDGTGFKNMKGNVVVKTVNYKSDTLDFGIDFGDKDSKDDLDCKAKFQCICAPEGYDKGCPGVTGDPFIGYHGLPELGTVFTVALSNAAPSSPALLFVGISDTHWQNVPLPLSLWTVLPGSSCRLLVSLDAMLSTRTLAPGVAHLPMQIPHQPSFVGAKLYMQWCVVDPVAPGGLAMSQGLKLQIRG